MKRGNINLNLHEVFIADLIEKKIIYQDAIEDSQERIYSISNNYLVKYDWNRVVSCFTISNGQLFVHCEDELCEPIEYTSITLLKHQFPIFKRIHEDEYGAI